MRKFKFFINYDKEEKWLKSMAEKGYELEKVSFGYKFHLIKPEETTIKIDFREFKDQKKFIDYCTLFEDSGWKHIAGSKNSGTQYFKKVGANVQNIFSDNISEAARYKRLSIVWSRSAITCLSCIIPLWTLGYMDIMALFNPKRLYLTPSLWEMEGSRFYNAFWFETPFAVFRGLLLLMPIVSIILYFIFAYTANKLYKGENGNDLF